MFSTVIFNEVQFDIGKLIDQFKYRMLFRFPSNMTKKKRTFHGYVYFFKLHIRREMGDI